MSSHIWAGLLAALAFSQLTSIGFAQNATPLWAHVPQTISPEWGKFFSEKGQGRERPVPAPNDIQGWKAL